MSALSALILSLTDGALIVRFGVETAFLLTGLTKIDLAEHQRFIFKYAFLTILVMTPGIVLKSVFPV